MKIAIQCRQDDSTYVEKADEILVDYRDRDYIFDLIEKYPNKKYILKMVPTDSSVDWTWVEQMNGITENLILCVDGDYYTLSKCAEKGFKFYSNYPVRDWAVLRAYAELGPKYVIPAGDLFFNLPQVKAAGIPIRLQVNHPYVSDLVQFVNTELDYTIVSEWVRPDDIDAYAEYVDTIEFVDVEHSKERALYRLYMQEKHWPGSIKMIIDNLKTDATNRMIEPEVFQHRINCGRKCLYGSPCRLCFRQFFLANYERIKNYKEEVIDK